MSEQDIFVAAIDIQDPAERSAYLDQACGDDTELRQRVQNLINQSDQIGSFLEHPPLEAAPEPPAQNAPTIIDGDGSTFDQDSGETVPEETLRQEPLSDEIPLGYLKPSADPKSLGRLGHYEIIEVVGQGAFGTVLRAFDEKLQRVVAIKVLAPEMASTSPARKRFLREARSSAKVRHENVVAIYAVEDDPIPYLVMEYVPGKTLKDRLEEQGPLDLPDVLRVGKQIADGLAAAHKEGLIHRDIKPGNILLEGGMDERVKITDFGLARTADDASMTQSGVIAGTPMYMAPEQAHGEKLDQRADLFSFGSVLYQMLSGRPPFRAKSTMAVLKRVTEDTPRPIQDIIPEVPRWMCDLIGHLHAKDPEVRYSSAREVSDLLAQCALDLQADRIPQIPDPSPAGSDEDTVIAAKLAKRVHKSRTGSRLKSPLVKLAAAVLLSIGLLGITEATGVTKISQTVIRLALGTGTLVIETDDSDLVVSVDGADVTISGAGIKQLTLTPGDHQVAALKNGETVREELVKITRDGEVRLRLSLEPDKTDANSSIAHSGDGWHGWPADAPPPAIAPFDAEQAKAHQEAWAKYLGVPVEYENSIGMKFRLIPPGEFMMGTSEADAEKICDRNKIPEWFVNQVKSETPTRRVLIRNPFYLGTTEVTLGQFKQFIAATNYQTHAETNGVGGRAWTAEGQETKPEFTWRHPDLASSDAHPVGQLCPLDAEAFCKWLRTQEGREYELPEEEQWEYACRAGTETWWSCGEDSATLEEYGLTGWDYRFKGLKVGERPANPFGLFDVHGNFRELCRSSSDGYVNRGGHSGPSIYRVRSARRSPSDELDSYNFNGFRVALRVNSVKQLRSGDSVTMASTTYKWPADAPPPAVAPFDAEQAKGHQEAWAKYLGVAVEYENSIGMTFRLIPPGEFLMGSTPAEIEAALKVGSEDEKHRERIISESPQHQVKLTQPVYVGVTEVTQSQYEQLMGTNPSHFSAIGEGKDAVAGMETASHPVERVGWNDAAEFCVKLSQQEQLKPFYFRSEETIELRKGPGYRLPTEAEWEYFCRAGTTTRFWSGDEDHDLILSGWFNHNSSGRTHTVAELRPNPFGLADVHGNVREWVQDSWDPAFYGKSEGDDAFGPSSPFSAGPRRVIRGGSWYHNPSYCRSSSRYADHRAVHNRYIGFRVVLPVDAVNVHPIGTLASLKAPFTDADVKRIAKLPPEEQIEEVRKELMRLNPGFDGKLTPIIEDDKVTELSFSTLEVTDISPVRALIHLKKLRAQGRYPMLNGALSNLSPLQGMQLEHLEVNYNRKIDTLEPLRGMPLKVLWAYNLPITDLSPLEGMELEELHLWRWRGTDLTPLKGIPLKFLNIGGNAQLRDLGPLADMSLEDLNINDARVTDLSPLKGMPLRRFLCQRTPVSDLTPLRGAPIQTLSLNQSQVTDLSPLQDMPLVTIICDFKADRDAEILRSIETLKKINDKPVAEFWKEVDAGKAQTHHKRLETARSIKDQLESKIEEAGAEHTDSLKLMDALAAAYQRADETELALEQWARKSALDPQDTLLALRVGVLQAWFGQDEKFAATVKRTLRSNHNPNPRWPHPPEKTAKLCCLLPGQDIAQVSKALELAQFAVEKGKDTDWYPHFLTTLGMAEYRNGNFAAADEAFASAIAEAGAEHDDLVATSSFFRAMILFRQDRKSEARELAISAASKMKPLPTDEQNPLHDGSSHDDVIAWLVYKEARTLIGFNEPPPTEQSATK